MQITSFTQTPNLLSEAECGKYARKDVLCIDTTGDRTEGIEGSAQVNIHELRGYICQQPLAGSSQIIERLLQGIAVSGIDSGQIVDLSSLLQEKGLNGR